MDENGLELSLGLSFGGSFGKQKGKVSSSDLGEEEDDRGNKSVSDFKGFLDSSKNKLDSTDAARDDAVKPQENFFSDLLKANALTDEEVGIEGSNKRKMLFDEISHQKKLPTPSVMRHSLSGAENEQPGIKAMTSGNAPVILGYSSVQLPMMDKDNSWVLAPHPAYTSKVPHTSALTPANPDSSSEVAQYGRSGRIAEIWRGDGKQHASEEGLSTLAEEDVKAATDNLFAKFTAIKPGMAADFKFGGCGSFPNLPWVSTTGPGPNGKTISGVTYQYSTNQIRIVCACHGSHLSPQEFLQHASEEKADPEDGTAALSTVQNNNPAASAQI